jgi:hypothetical protein
VPSLYGATIFAAPYSDFDGLSVSFAVFIGLPAGYLLPILSFNKYFKITIFYQPIWFYILF